MKKKHEPQRWPAGWITCAALTMSCGVEEGPATKFDSDPVVYGNDDRRDVYDHPNATLRTRARESTCSQMKNVRFDTSDRNNVRFLGPTLGEKKDLCSTERFRNDPASGSCSATLIDDDLVLTAGHCITSSKCRERSFVFRYYRNGPDSLQRVTAEDIFTCAEIVVRKDETVGNRKLDYAIIRLDRNATPRFTPAPVRTGDRALARGTNVAVIGNPNGIPFKIDSGGAVRTSRSELRDYFVATTDTFGGNSGSGVYETDRYTVAGILVRGETDYVSRGSCNVVNTCSETGCSGEEITYVARAIEDLCDVAPTARLCGGSPPPPPSGNGFDFSASNTDSARRNTVNRTVTLNPGQTITAGTCGQPGASFSGDTYLRLFAGGSQVAANDDACGGLGSQLSYTSPGGGPVEIRAGCYRSTSCSGVVVW